MIISLSEQLISQQPGSIKEVIVLATGSRIANELSDETPYASAAGMLLQRKGKLTWKLWVWV